MIKARVLKLAKILSFFAFVGFLLAPRASAENLRVDRILGKAEIMNITTSQARQASALEDFHAGEKILLQKTGGLRWYPFFGQKIGLFSEMAPKDG